MGSMKKRVLISGAGASGLATALLLDQKQFDVSIIEKGDRFMSAGYSIILWQRGYEVLEELIGSKINEIVGPINKIHAHGGSDMEHINYADTTGIGHSVLREDLISYTSKAVLARFGKGVVRFNTTIDDIRFNDDAGEVILSSGEVENYDIVIAADGVNSKIRDLHFATQKKTGPYKINYQWIGSKTGLSNEAIVGFMKDYLFLIQTTPTDALLAYYNFAETDNNDEFEAQLSNMITRDYGGKLKIDEKSRTNFVSTKIHIHKPYVENLVVVGDAYHGHPPTLAMGTSLALEDAKGLTHELNQNPEDIHLAFKNYAKLREHRGGKVFDSQDMIEKMFLTHSAVQAEAVKEMLSHGGWFFVDHLIRNVVTN